MEMNKAHNLIEHRDEILSRPARVWFTEDSKKKAQPSKTKYGICACVYIQSLGVAKKQKVKQKNKKSEVRTY